ncbi:MAG: glycine oxidase ThiO [Actinomycetota bacterium]|nr:glycine oxidase ThiO [Actinomycetota bacterium]
MIAGGGVIGLGIAWRAASAGLEVVVADARPGRGASWAAAGMLAPVTEVHYGEVPLLALNLESHARYPRFVAELQRDAGVAVGHRRCGTLLVARDQDDNAALAEVFMFQQRLGLEVTRLRSREVRDLEPSLVPSVRGGIMVEGDHQVDNRSLVEALLRACAARGVTFEVAKVARVDIEDDSVTGVVLSDRRHLAAAQVVIAAGAHSGRIDGTPLLRVRPVKGQLLHLRSRDATPLPSRNIRGLEVYLVPRPDGRLVVGATVEEQGFDPAVTAGAVHDLLRAASELFPGVAEMELVEVAVGHRPGTPDNAPLLGPAGVRGLIIATGHYRNGVLLLPVTADAISALLNTGEVPGEIAPFSPRRFDRVEQAS